MVQWYTYSRHGLLHAEKKTKTLNLICWVWELRGAAGLIGPGRCICVVWQLNVSIYMVRVMKLWIIPHDGIHVPTHQYSAVITTWPHEYSVLMSRTTPSQQSGQESWCCQVTQNCFCISPCYKVSRTIFCHNDTHLCYVARYVMLCCTVNQQ